MAIKNMAASVLTRLKNQSKEEGILIGGPCTFKLFSRHL